MLHRELPRSSIGTGIFFYFHPNEKQKSYEKFNFCSANVLLSNELWYPKRAEA